MKNFKDNFLNQEEFNRINQIMLDEFFPWYFQREQVLHEDDGFWFSHKLYDFNRIHSEFYNQIIPIFEKKLDYLTLIRVTCNLLTKREKPIVCSFHTDYNDSRSTTAIFYLNTNNGYTEMKNGTKIKSVKNRFIEFSSPEEHRAIGQTDEPRRIVINFNYIAKNIKK